MIRFIYGIGKGDAKGGIAEWYCTTYSYDVLVVVEKKKKKEKKPGFASSSLLYCSLARDERLDDALMVLGIRSDFMSLTKLLSRLSCHRNLL